MVRWVLKALRFCVVRLCDEDELVIDHGANLAQSSFRVLVSTSRRLVKDHLQTTHLQEVESVGAAAGEVLH